MARKTRQEAEREARERRERAAPPPPRPPPAAGPSRADVELAAELERAVDEALGQREDGRERRDRGPGRVPPPPPIEWWLGPRETGRHAQAARETGLAQPSHPRFPYADGAWQYPGTEQRLREIQRQRAKESVEEGRYREAGLAQPRRDVPPWALKAGVPRFDIPPAPDFSEFASRMARAAAPTTRRQERLGPIRADERARVLQEYPWSPYGEHVVSRAVMGRMGPVEGALFQALFGGQPEALDIGLGPIDFLRLRSGGEAVPHELAHTAQFATALWSEIADDFGDALETWLGQGDWDEEKQLLHDVWTRREALTRGAGDVEAYATLAQTPWLIPPELERYYPQYDLRSRGQTARPGYRGPTYPSFYPPTRPTGLKIR